MTDIDAAELALCHAIVADRQAQRQAAITRQALHAVVARSPLPETRLAALVGVSRATIREWRGKPRR